MLLGILAAPLTVSAASAADVDFALEVVTDGNGPFTPDDQPGGDSGDANGIVRTFDSVTYRASVNSNGGPSTNERFTVTAPEGTSWAGLPSLCAGEGSVISGQDLTCNLGTVAEGQVQAVPLVLNVGGGLRNGDQLQVSGAATADDSSNGSVPASSPITTVSAAARYDLSKRADTVKLTPDTPGPDGSLGTLLQYPLTVNWSPIVNGQGLLGFEQAEGTMRFTDDVSRMLGDLPSTAVLFAPNGAPVCGPNSASYFGGLPAGAGGGDRAVLDSGTFSCTQSAPGQPIDIELSGVDTAIDLGTIPALGAAGGAVNGGAKPYVVSGFISIWVPQLPAGASVLAVNTFTALDADSISGASNFPGGTEPLENNSQERNLSSFVGVGGFKYLGQVPNPSNGYTVPGSARQGDPYVTPGQVARSQVALVNGGTGQYTGAIACDVFDNRYQRITETPARGYAWTNGWAAGERLEYAAFGFTDPEVGRTATCGDDDGPWYASPEDVPGGAAAVGKVRVVGDVAGGRTASLFSYVEILSAPDLTRVLDFGQLYAGADGDGEWLHDRITPVTGAGPLADSVIITSYKARVTKKIVDEDSTPGNTPDKTSFVLAGQSLDYALYPTLTNARDGSPQQVTVQDTLPLSSTYHAGSASIPPTTIETVTDQAGQERQRLTWVLEGVVPNEPIDPISYTVDFSKLAVAGAVTNYVTIASPGDQSPAFYRDFMRNVRIVTSGGIGVEKSAVAPTVIAGDDLVWTLGYTNIDAQPVSGTDLIDALPADGDDRGSAFSGTASLSTAITVDAAAGEAVLYTVTPADRIVLDAADPSNGPGGSTVWCSEEQFGTADCPASLTDVTGFRITRSGEIAVGETVSHTVTLASTGAVSGDQFVNRFGLRASNLVLPVQSNRATITVVAGELGDFAWFDLNGDGLQDADEPGAPEVPVHLTGTDDRGATVERSTTTDEDGHYVFTGLRPGDYTLVFTAPDGREFTLQHVGDDPALDSDVDAAGATGIVSLVTELDDEGALAGVSSDLTVDAGVLPAPDEVIPPVEPPAPGTDDGTGTGTPAKSGELASTGPSVPIAIGLVALLAMAVGGAALMIRNGRRRS